MNTVSARRQTVSGAPGASSARPPPSIGPFATQVESSGQNQAVSVDAHAVQALTSGCRVSFNLMPLDQVFPQSVERHAMRSPSAPPPFSPQIAEIIKLMPLITILKPRCRPSAQMRPCDTLTAAEKFFPPSLEILKNTALPSP